MTQPQQASYIDILKGRPANGLVWQIDSGNISCQNPPADESFYTQHGRQFLRSSSWERKKSRQKDRPQGWYTTIYDDLKYTETQDGEYDVFTWETPVGVVIGRRHENHFCEYPLKSINDLDIWTYVHRHMRFRPNVSQDERETSFGLSWSPAQQLLQFDMGIENFYYFLLDASEKMAVLLDVMQERCLERLRLGLSLFLKAAFGRNQNIT